MNPTTILAHQPDGHTTIAIDGGFTTTTPNRALGYILAEALHNPPDGVDFVAWADHYVRNIWPDEVRFMTTNGAPEPTPTDLEPIHVVCAGIGLGLLTLPDGWDFGPWHPTGLHLYGTTHSLGGCLNIVITGWDDDDEYTVGLYDWECAEYLVDADGNDAVYGVRPDDLVAWLAGIITLAGVEVRPPLTVAPLAADRVMP